MNPPLTGRHPDWLAARTKLMVAANAADCPSVEFDDACNAMGALEKAIIFTPAGNRTEAEAKLRLCADLNAEGSVLDRDDAGDLMADIAPFLAPLVDRAAWDAAKDAYVAARTREVEYDRQHCHVPTDLPVGPERTAIIRAIPDEAWAPINPARLKGQRP